MQTTQNNTAPLIGMVYFNTLKPLFIGYIPECVKIRELHEPNPHEPHKLKIKVLEKPKKFINFL